MSIEEVGKKMEFIDGKYLDSVALPNAGVTVTVKSMKSENIQNMRTFKDEPKKILYVEELPWGIVLGAKCNRKRLLELAKGDSKNLIGQKITIYRDPDVKFGKKKVGAIRIK